MYELTIPPKITEEISPLAKKFIARSADKAQDVVVKAYEYIGAGSFLPKMEEMAPVSRHVYFAPYALINQNDAQVAKFIRIA